MKTNKSERSLSLQRSLTFFPAFSFVVGSIVGAGIFLTPSLIARRTPNLFVSILAWILAGGLALLGSLCYCEMVSMIKKTGGSYIFVLDCYGKAAGFLVSMSNSIVHLIGAYIFSITIGSYACSPFFKDHTTPEYDWVSKCVAITAILMVTAINSLGTKKSGILQIVFVTIQMLVMLTVIGVGVYSITTTTGTGFDNLKPEVFFNNTWSGLRNDIPSFAIATLNALYCFEGYITLAFVVEEVQNPTKTIPLLAFTAVPFVSFIYIIVNLAAGSTLSYGELSASHLFLYDMAYKVGGKTLTYIIPLSVPLVVLPALSSVFYRFSRQMMSTAREGQFPSFFAFIHTKRRTPIPAVLFISVATIVLLVIGFKVDTMIQTVTVCLWFEYAFTISTILVNRWRKAGVVRRYRTWITTPLLMTVIPIAILCLAFVENPVSTTISIGLILLALPIYYISLHKKWLKFIPQKRFESWLMKKFSLVACDVEDEEGADGAIDISYN